MAIFVRDALCIRYQTPCTDGGSGDFLVQGRTLRPFPPLVLFREKLVKEASGFDAEKQNIRVLNHGPSSIQARASFGHH